MGARHQIKRHVRSTLQRCDQLHQAITNPLTAPLRRQYETRRRHEIQSLKRIRSFIPPTAAQAPSSSHIALFSHYSPSGTLQRCIRRLLSELRKSDWSVILLTDQLNDDGQAWCKSNGVGILLRTNEGRDFGAFQDGWLMLHAEGLLADCERLILINDSIYPIANLANTTWPIFLRGDGDCVLGFTDSYQNGYHLQSYALHFPASVFQQSWWHDYWQNYPGWGGMKIAIRDGEIGLSQRCLENNVSLRALHPVSEVRAMIISQAFQEKLSEKCSTIAINRIIQELLTTAKISANHFSPAHHWAVPLLMSGHPFIKRWLFESNNKECLDPLLVVGGDTHYVIPYELTDFVRPPILGYAG